jgi:hypothetical protein
MSVHQLINLRKKGSPAALNILGNLSLKTIVVITDYSLNESQNLISRISFRENLASHIER